MITSTALVEKFRFALDNHWGYIWGQSGAVWTQAKQNQKINYMVKNYGENWKKNADAKKSDYYNAASIGSKWIGHNVADCSGLFVWAFRELGGSIAHGSNSIYDKYCTTKGKLTDSLKKTIQPGTAVFTGDSKSHGHIGLYVGNGKVIEDMSTDAGVVTSNVTAGKWTYYGLLKGVDYGTKSDEKQPSPAEPDKLPTTNLPTLRKGSTGEYVTLLQTKLKNKGYDLGKYGVDGDFGSATLAAVKQFQRDNGLEVDGVVGKNTWAALEKDTQAVYYSVVIPHLTAEKADQVIALYKGAFKEIEKG